MKKKNNIISKGTLREKAILYVEETARRLNGHISRISNSEYDMLFSSLQTARGLKYLDEIETAHKYLSAGVLYLQGALFETKINLSDLRGYILTWASIDSAELIANLILSEFKDENERKRIANLSISSGASFLLSKIDIDNEGFLNVNTKYDTKDEKKEPTLDYVINIVRQRCIKSATKYISWREAIIDYMKDNKIELASINEAISNYDEKLYNPIVGWYKYIENNELFENRPRLKKLIQEYSITPDISKIEIDDNEYTWFRMHLLKDNYEREAQ